MLQNAVSQLRRSLGDNLIVTRAPGYLLRVEPDAIDARRFESLLEEGRRMIAGGETEEAAAILHEALGLWRGRALDEFAYERFAETEIARLEELRLRALEERIEVDLALGRHADLVGELERLVAQHPLRERPSGQLMLALYRSGRQAEALRIYQEGRRLLAEELGLEPGAALQRLEKQILTHDPALEPRPLVPPPKEERRREAAPETGPGRPGPAGGPLALGLAAIALTAAALVAAFLLADGNDPAPTAAPNSLVKIDPETGEIVDVFRVGLGPSTPAIVGNYVFVSSDRETLSRIDVRSGEVETFGGITTRPAGIAAGADGTLWVGSSEGTNVWQIGARDFNLLRVLELPDGVGPSAVAVGGGSVWVSHNLPASVSRFSARTGTFQQRYAHPLGGFAVDVAFGAGAAWAAANEPVRGELLRIGGVFGRVRAIELGRVPHALAVGLGAVWVSDLVEPPAESGEPEAGKVLRVDPATGALDAVIPVGKRPAELATGGGSVWVANSGERTISEIDPRTNTVVKTIATRYFPYSLVYGHGFLWVSLHSKPFAF